jgi:4-hydroxy-L-threonine phosphate dehydrogenase PdxA
VDFESAVNVALGLSTARTSVGHGPALDMAWNGIASTRSQPAASALARRLCGKATGWCHGVCGAATKKIRGGSAS